MANTTTRRIQRAAQSSLRKPWVMRGHRAQRSGARARARV